MAGRFDAPELDHTRLHHLPEVPENFEADWRGVVGSSVWGDRKVIQYSVDRAYMTAVTQSVKVRSFVRIPKVQEAIIRENFQPTSWRDTATQVLVAIDAPAEQSRRSVWPRLSHVNETTESVEIPSDRTLRVKAA
jgi:hypothetical protein